MGLVEYMTPSTKIGWVPNTFVDVTFQISSKYDNLFQSFQSQMDKPYFTKEVFDNIKFLPTGGITSKNFESYLDF